MSLRLCVTCVSTDTLTLLPPRRMASKLKEDLWPRFGRLPDQWRNCVPLAPILLAAFMRLKLSCDVLVEELAAMAAQHPALSAEQLALSVRLANELADNMPPPSVPLATQEEEEERPATICVATASSQRLLSSTQVFLNDAPWASQLQGEDSHELLHEEISHKAGRLLGCSSIRDELARVCKSKPLHRRIEGLLQKYSDEKDAFVEQ
jgi:hypothetical protein